MQSAADTATNIQHASKPKTKRRNIPKWSTYELSAAKRSLNNKAAELCRDPFHSSVRASYFLLLKNYRKMNKSLKRRHINNLVQQLDELHENDPKQYWQLVEELKNVSGNKKKAANPIQTEEWGSYFSDLNKNKIPNVARRAEIECKLKEFESFRTFNNLDFTISEGEIGKAIKALKNGKAPGLDRITGNMFKAGMSAFICPLKKLYNLVFSTSKYPQEWCKGYITPIHKSGNPRDPSNYRGIAITNTIAKIFNTILNNRLVTYIQEKNIIHYSQIGFLRKSRTCDHIFVLKTMIDKYIKQNKKLYTCFVDLKKAFDTVWHTGLLYKLQTYGIGGQLYEVVKDMYQKTNLCARNGDELSCPFQSEIGIRQGDVLSPYLFNLYINDLPTIFDDSCKPPTLLTTQIPCLLYADDLVIMSETKGGLQNGLDKLAEYCDQWFLSVNILKTNVIIFNKCGRLIKEKFLYKDNNIECAKSYTYLGVTISISGNFAEAKDRLYNKGLKAYFKLKSSFGTSMPKIQTVLHIFDHTVKPILL